MRQLWQNWLQTYRGFSFQKQKLIYVLYAGAMFIFLYMLTGYVYLGTPRKLPLTWIDINTPLLVWTFWIYISDYFFLGMAGMLCPTPNDFNRFRRTFWTLITINIGIFFFFPTTIERVSLEGITGISVYIAKYVHTVDVYTNCCPSLHVSVTLLGTFVLIKHYPRLFLPILIWGIAIALSTLTTKQHYWYDVVCGTILAVCVFVYEYVYKAKVDARLKAQ